MNEHEHDLTFGQLAIAVQKLDGILNELRQGTEWEGVGNYRQVEDGARVDLIPSATSDTKLLGGRHDRREALIYNDSTAVLYVKWGRGASATSYSTQIPAGGLLIVDKYAGPLHGCWATVNGQARVTEF